MIALLLSCIPQHRLLAQNLIVVMSAKRLLSLEQQLEPNHPLLQEESTPCLEVPADKQISLGRLLCDDAKPKRDRVLLGLSDADLLFLLGAALLETHRNGR